jgi:enamine deaminase RidA (YjgF/YER057c/UK114 family)
MKIEHLNPPAMVKPGGHYSHATVAAGLVLVSGQLPITAACEKLNPSKRHYGFSVVLEAIGGVS